jgi:hypothetical protein
VIILVFALILSAFVVALAIRTNNYFQCLPTLTWSLLSITPLIYNWNFFDIQSRNLQAIGVLLISVALSIGDAYSMQKASNKTFKLVIGNNLKAKIFIVSLILISVLIPIIHYMFAGSLPILKVFEHFSPMQVAKARENYTKLGLPDEIKYLPNIFVNIIGPITITILYLTKKYFLAAILIIYSIFYAVSSTQKGPVIIFIGFILFSVIFYLPNNYRNLIAGAITALQIIIIFFGVWYGNVLSNESSKCPVPNNVSNSPANINRSCSDINKITINKVVDNIGYRLFLAPVEVSNNWYRYYIDNNNQERTIFDLLNRDPSKQASNIVGVWAYERNWPDRYLTSLNAYSSLDADAYSFGGLYIVFFVSLVLLFIRMYIGNVNQNAPPIVKMFEGLALVQLIVFPFQASIQAITLAQFLIVILAIIFVLRNINKVLAEQK